MASATASAAAGAGPAAPAAVRPPPVGDDATFITGLKQRPSAGGGGAPTDARRDPEGLGRVKNVSVF